MLLLRCNNDIKCWNCKEDCDIKDVMKLPDFIFMPSIMQFLKANAGIVMSHGISLDTIEEELKITSVGLYLAREKLLEEKEK